MNCTRVLFLAILLAPGCQSASSAVEGVGDPCVPHDETNPNFPGFSAQEVSIETGSPSCQTQLCLINKFQGRVTCPYGATGGGDHCALPGTDPHSSDTADKVNTAVSPQLVDRREDEAVYCSCRCANQDGATDDGGDYCTCPSGFSCEELVPDLGLSSENLGGAYCVKTGTNQVPSGRVCSEERQDCPAKYEY